MKLQFFSLTPSVPGVNMLRLKDGVYSRVPLLPGAPVEVRRKVLCEDAGAPVSQVWARALDKELYADADYQSSHRRTGICDPG